MLLTFCEQRRGIYALKKFEFTIFENGLIVNILYQFTIQLISIVNNNNMKIVFLNV